MDVMQERMAGIIKRYSCICSLILTVTGIGAFTGAGLAGLADHISRMGLQEPYMMGWAGLFFCTGFCGLVPASVSILLLAAFAPQSRRRLPGQCVRHVFLGFILGLLAGTMFFVERTARSGAVCLIVPGSICLVAAAVAAMIGRDGSQNKVHSPDS
jgi:hypothetical protein